MTLHPVHVWVSAPGFNNQSNLQTLVLHGVFWPWDFLCLIFFPTTAFHTSTGSPQTWQHLLNCKSPFYVVTLHLDPHISLTLPVSHLTFNLLFFSCVLVDSIINCKNLYFSVRNTEIVMLLTFNRLPSRGRLSWPSDLHTTRHRFYIGCLLWYKPSILSGLKTGTAFNGNYYCPVPLNLYFNPCAFWCKSYFTCLKYTKRFLSKGGGGFCGFKASIATHSCSRHKAWN